MPSLIPNTIHDAGPSMHDSHVRHAAQETKYGPHCFAYILRQGLTFTSKWTYDFRLHDIVMGKKVTERVREGTEAKLILTQEVKLITSTTTSKRRLGLLPSGIGSSKKATPASCPTTGQSP